jgi:short chain dehydrogenase
MAGEVALVLGGEHGVGRAIALALGAKGVHVVVAGSDERALGRVVGEITCGGGSARHVAGQPSDPMYIAATVAKAVETFGKLTFVLAVSLHPDEIHQLAHASLAKLGSYGRALLVMPASAEHSGAYVLAGLATQLRAHHATCNRLLWEGPDDADFEGLAEVALFLCSDVADGINSQTLKVTV